MGDERWEMGKNFWMLNFGCWMLNFFLTRRHEDTKEGRWGAVSLEDLKVEGGEIDDPTSLVELPSSHKL
jgi:hypothetical protein